MSVNERDVEEIIARMMDKEYRKDSEFRLNILMDQIGSVARYITHDPVLNPPARPHGGKEDEKLAYGQAFLQLRILAYLRNINYEEAMNSGLKNWLDDDWKKKGNQDLEKNNGRIRGIVGCPGRITGRAYLAKSYGDLVNLRDSKVPSIVVMSFAKSDFVVAREYITGVVTNHGGKMSHAAVNCLDFGIPCIVGTGNATELIGQGDFIELDASASGENYVKILERAAK
ncbi:MAG: PEP-utilizing enzyme [Candidatus Nanoarchaeia archaeon]